MKDIISVVIATYNYPLALKACLKSLLAQTDQHFEILIADDGSAEDSVRLVERFIAEHDLSIRHVYQEDIGFRAGMIRNKAVAQSVGEYVVFLDGDCVVLPSFISRHRALAEPGYFVPGNRILINQRCTENLLARETDIHNKDFVFFAKLWLKRDINRILPLFYLRNSWWRYFWRMQWENAMTCNLGVWRKDLISVNGFDETYAGWGHEDSDLVIRLLHSGVKRKEGRFATPVLHLWHPHSDRSQQAQNKQRLLNCLNTPTRIRAAQGVDQYV